MCFLRGRNLAVVIITQAYSQTPFLVPLKQPSKYYGSLAQIPLLISPFPLLHPHTVYLQLPNLPYKKDERALPENFHIAPWYFLFFYNTQFLSLSPLNSFSATLSKKQLFIALELITSLNLISDTESRFIIILLLYIHCRKHNSLCQAGKSAFLSVT